MKALIRLRIYKTCPAYGTVTQHVVRTTYTTDCVSKAAEGYSQWHPVGKTAVTHH